MVFSWSSTSLAFFGLEKKNNEGTQQFFRCFPWNEIWKETVDPGNLGSSGRKETTNQARISDVLSENSISCQDKAPNPNSQIQGRELLFLSMT